MSDGWNWGVVSPSDISVVIAATDREESPRRCIAAIAGSTARPREVIVVSDASGEAIAAQATSLQWIRFIDLPLPLGAAAARNLAALAAHGSVLLFLDADVEVRPETIEQIADAMTANRHAAAIVGSYDDEPAAPGPVSQYLNFLHHFDHQTADAEAVAFWSVCGAIRASAFKAIGGFEAGHWLQDVELGYRLRHGGYRIAMCPQVQVKSLKRWTLATMIRAELRSRAAWMRIALTSSDSRGTGSALAWSRRLNVLLAAITPGLIVVAVVAWRPALSLALVTAALWLRANKAIFQFLDARRGRWFALRSIPLHWVHVISAGAGLFIGLVQHLLATSKGSAERTDDSADESVRDLRS